MDTSSAVPLVKAFLPKVPLIGKTAISHTLGFSEHSKFWDLRTELTVNVLRSFIIDGPAQSVSKLQHLSIKDPGIKGRIWISKVSMPIPSEDDIRQGLFRAIEGLKDPGEASGGYKEPELLPVEAEWTGYRAGATKQSTRLKIAEEQQYKELMREVTSPVTVLYFHGGAHYLMDPASHRPSTKKLAKLTKGRVFSVRYRLAPKNPFPAAVLDALVAYFTLLYPPAGSFHEAIDPKHIVLAGDSAGGNLCLALLQTLLELRRQSLKIRWNGEEREVPMPAGAALCSPWTDVTHSSPSCSQNGSYDYLPALTLKLGDRQPPPCTIWPADPPRRNMYAEDACLVHPICSPLAAKSWEGCCPLYMDAGKELLTDEIKYVAMSAARQGVKVVYEEYEAMPHCFAMLLTTIGGAKRFFDGWSSFISAAVERPEDIQTKGLLIKAKTLEEVPLNVEELSSESHEAVIERMKRAVRDIDGKQPDTMAKL
ncbi:AB hydrolase superfamily [Hyphodiscus hymeniophilus]|uniref:AB hydrolase superfamily n=1 Tax=Hyphodiscus hymeniophilus TaxID=353542 RepID=A0A9P6VKS5_9HELO|nr:AB hydrolase superfamily [Hyphodiscus hymeniophilus]